MNHPEWPQMLLLKEVAAMFGVGSKTVARWEKQGWLSSIRTPGNHRRFNADQVRRLMEARGQQ